MLLVWGAERMYRESKPEGRGMSDAPRDAPSPLKGV